jgi:hypothetical protein
MFYVSLKSSKGWQKKYVGLIELWKNLMLASYRNSIPALFIFVCADAYNRHD